MGTSMKHYYDQVLPCIDLWTSMVCVFENDPRLQNRFH